MLVIVVGLFAVIGALLRDGVGVLSSHWWTGLFPFGTLIVNLLGCFVLGWFSAHIKKLDHVHSYIKTGVGTGLVGSFTTFSTFSVDTIRLFETGHPTLGFVYLIDSYIGGIAFVFLGHKLGTYIMLRRGGDMR